MSRIHLSFALPAVVVLVACGGEQPAPQPPVAEAPPPKEVVTAAPPPSTAEAKPVAKPSLSELMKKTFLAQEAAFNAHDSAKMSETYSADAVSAMPMPEGWKEQKG